MRKITCLMVLSLGSLLRAQGSDPWSALRAKNPPEIEVAARLVDPQTYLAGPTHSN